MADQGALLAGAVAERNDRNSFFRELAAAKERVLLMDYDLGQWMRACEGGL